MAELQRKLQEQEKSCEMKLQTEWDSITLTFLKAGEQDRSVRGQ